MSKRVGRRLLTLIVIACACAQLALAQNNGPFRTTTANDILQQFKDQRVLWTTNIWVYANTLFGILAVIEFAWSAAVMLLEKTDLQSWTSALIRKLMWIGAFYALLINGRIWIPAIIDSFSQIGASAAGMAAPLSPGDVFVQGLNIAGALIDAGSTSAFFTNPGTSFALVLCALLIVVSYIIITLNFIVTMVESYLVVSVGFIFLGFGGSRWTVPYTERYIGLAISIGIKIVLLYCLITAGMNLGLGWIDEAQTIGTAPHPNMVAFDVMGAALIFMMCCWQIPKLFAAVLGGSPALAGGDLWGTGMAVAGAGVAAASLGVGAVAGAVSGGAALSGAGSATSAGSSNFGIASSIAGVSSGGSAGGAAGGAVPPPASPPRGPSTNGGGPRQQPGPPVSSGSGMAGLDSTFASSVNADVEPPNSHTSLTGNRDAQGQGSINAVLAGIGGESLMGSGFEGETTARGFGASVVGTSSINQGRSSGPGKAAGGHPHPDARAGGGPADMSTAGSEIGSISGAGPSNPLPPRNAAGSGITGAVQSAGNSLKGASRRLDGMRYRLSKMPFPSDAAPHQSPPRMPVEHED